MQRHIVSLALCALVAAGCGNRNNNSNNAPAADPHAGHSHAGHDHSGHDHSGHDHAKENHSGHALPAPAKEEGSHAEGEIIFPAEQAALTDFKVEAVQPAPFADVIRTSGQILPAQGDQQCLSASVSGIVSFGEVKLTEGSAVRKGETLFYISSKNIASGDAAQRIKAAYEKARAEYERVVPLAAEQILSQRELEAAQYDYRQAKAEWEAIAGHSTARGVAVTAPTAGYVSGLQVHEGDFVEMGTLLASVARGRRMELRAEVSQRYYDRLRAIRTASFLPPYGERALDLKEMGGKLVSIGQATAAGGYMIPVTFEFDNPGGLASGSYVEVFMRGEPHGEVISVPVGAVTEQQGLFYVYVQLDEEGYLRREVKPGASDGGRIVILSGLEPGERVVTRGAVQVRMAAMSGAIPHGHSH